MQSPRQLQSRFPLPETLENFIIEKRDECRQIIERIDNRLLIVVGPCSIHSPADGIEYAKLLKPLADEVQDHALVVMRASLEKPRTAMGWRGLAQDPYLNGSADIAYGIETSREFLIQLATLRVPAAMEFLTPHLTPYFEDLITWGWIGARTSSSQPHRLMASHLPMPVGMKNTIDGNIHCALHATDVARHSHTFPHIDKDGQLCVVKSKGNPHAHLVLRGSNSGPNYDREEILRALDQLRQLELPPRVLIDCSHGNCKQKYFHQKDVFCEILDLVHEGNEQIIGMMIESHLEAGKQAIPSNLSELQKGVSITDPCLDFSETAALLRSLVPSPTLMSLT